VLELRPGVVETFALLKGILALHHGGLSVNNINGVIQFVFNRMQITP
jgi:hypothetical protein